MANVASNWSSRYNKYVRLMTCKYEGLNAKSETITHKATPEETAFYENLLEQAFKKNDYLEREIEKRRKANEQ